MCIILCTTGIAVNLQSCSWPLSPIPWTLETKYLSHWPLLPSGLCYTTVQRYVHMYYNEVTVLAIKMALIYREDIITKWPK